MAQQAAAVDGALVEALVGNAHGIGELLLDKGARRDG